MARKAQSTSDAPVNTNNPLMRATAALDKMFGDNKWRVALDNNTMRESLPHIPTGVVSIDYLFGGSPNKFGVRTCPGIPKGRITQVYGTESSGKTTLALTIAASVAAQGGTVAFIDYENAISIAYAASLGVPVTDPSRFLLAQPDTLEDGFKTIYLMASAGVDLIIIDSVGAAVPADVASQDIKDMGKQRIGLLAQKWSQYLPQMRARITKTGTAVFAIAQIRESLNTMGYGESTTVQGGRAWKFYPDLRVKLDRIKQETTKAYNAVTHVVEDQKASGVIRARIEKCKVSDAQGKEGIFYIKYGRGIDDDRSFIEIAIAHGVIKKGGAWLTWARTDGSEIRGQGQEKFREELAKAKAMDELRKMVIPFLVGAKVDIALDDDEDDDDGLNLDGLMGVGGSTPGLSEIAELDGMLDE